MSATGESADTEPSPPRRRGIYLLPNLFTTATLFGGFYAIVASLRGEFVPAAMAIFAAMVADTLDGRVARLTNTQTDFGKEYDSLSDMVTFGLASGVVIYIYTLHSLAGAIPYGGKLAWLGAFVYTACAALRLARFNVSAHLSGGKGYFFGLPSPSAAGVTAGFVWVCAEMGISGESPFVAITAFVLTIMAALLMISNVRYYSFKDLNLKERVPFIYIVAIVGLFVLVSFDPPKVAFSVFLVYMVSGPVITLLRRRRKRHGVEAGSSPADDPQ